MWFVSAEEERKKPGWPHSKRASLLVLKMQIHSKMFSDICHIFFAQSQFIINVRYLPLLRVFGFE